MGNTVTQTIIIIIVVLFIGAFIGRLTARGKRSSIVNSIPGILVTLGILGTFLGIFIAILAFDVSDIQGSVPSLLEGMKTAFITSIAGMLGSILLTFIFRIEDDITASTTKETSKDPVEILQEISRVLVSLDSTSKSIETTIVKCFQSEDQSSMVSQMKLIRSDMGDMKREIKDAMDIFSEKVSEFATKGIMDALRSVLEKFNAALSEVVGKAFDDLAQAVIKLVEWQENYRSHVENFEKHIETTLRKATESVNVLSESGSHLSEIKGNLSQIGNIITPMGLTIKELEETIKELQHQNKLMENMLKSIRDIGKEAKGVIPEISRNMNELTKNFAEAEKSFTGRLRESLDSMVGAFAAISQKFADDYTPLADKLQKIVRIAEDV